MAKKGTDGNADRRTDQHPADIAVVAEAEARLRELPGTGLTSASRLGEGKSKSGVLKSFEPMAEETLFIPRRMSWAEVRSGGEPDGLQRGPHQADWMLVAPPQADQNGLALVTAVRCPQALRGHRLRRHLGVIVLYRDADVGPDGREDWRHAGQAELT
jgi:hypothetical protein